MDFNVWQFFEDILYKIYKNENMGYVNIHLNGGRKSGKTYNALNFIARAIMLQKNNMDVFLFRWLKGDAQALFDEMLWHINYLTETNWSNVNLSKKLIKINENKIQVMGIHSNSTRKKIELVGLERAKNKKYAIIFIEECVEFSSEEILNIKHAIGGYLNLIFIYASNPNSLLLNYVKELNFVLPYNVEELSTKGYQYLKLNNNIYFYQNWRVNKYLSEADIQTIKETWNIDKQRAKVVDWGIPGIESNLIYANEIEKLKILPFKELPFCKEIYIGLDWGDSQEEEGSATALEIVGISKNEGNIIYEEYFWHNKDFYKDTFTRIREMLDKVEEFFNREGFSYFKRKGVDFVMDRGLYSERDFLQIEANKRGLSWINFKFCLKNLERTRINIRKYLINTDRYWINESCKKHIEELQTQTWDIEHFDKNGLYKQKDLWNHTTDAIDYAQSYRQYEVLREDNYKILYKGEK